MTLTKIVAQDAGGSSTGKQFTDAQVRQSIFDILSPNVLCSLATVTPDGHAHINTAHFCYSDELELYFLTHPHSTHCRNLAVNASAAITVFSSSQPWFTPGAGVQLFGTCKLVEAAETENAEERYGKRFSGYSEWKVTRTDGLSSEYRFYHFVTFRLKVLDEANLGDGVIVSAVVARN